MAFTDIAGFKFVVVQALKYMEETHGHVVTAMQRLGRTPSSEEIQQLVACGKCRSVHTSRGTAGRQCAFCDVTELFMVYETTIFRDSTVTLGRQMLAVEEEDDVTAEIRALRAEQGFYHQCRGTIEAPQQGPADLERALLFISGYLGRTLGSGWGHSGQRFFSHMEGLKKEFFELRKLWQHLWHRVSALDELDMCIQRMVYPGLRWYIRGL